MVREARTKHPWFRMFPGDWLTDRHVRAMPLAARAVYFDMLCHEWLEGPLPSDPHALARHLGLDVRTVRAVLPSILGRFAVDSAGFLVQNRLETERNRARIKADLCAKAALSRHTDDADALHEGDVSARQSQRSESEVRNQTKTEKKKRARPKTDAQPMPFKIGEALDELARSSGGRFVTSRLNAGQAKNITRLVRENPALSTWTLVGEWLAAGGESWKVDLDVRALSGFSAWVAHATKWNSDGRPPIHRNGTNGAQQSLGYAMPSVFTESRDAGDDFA